MKLFAIAALLVSINCFAGGGFDGNGGSKNNLSVEASDQGGGEATNGGIDHN